MTADDFHKAARRIGAVNGVLERSGVARAEHMTGEHRACIDAVISSIGEPACVTQWKHGYWIQPDEVLREALGWQPNVGTSE